MIEKYYTAEQLEYLKQRRELLGEERIGQTPAEWAELMVLVRVEIEMGTAPTDPKVQALWGKLVHEPVHRAVTRYQPILKRHKMLDQVFRFQDLDALVDRLEASENAGVKPPKAAAKS